MFMTDNPKSNKVQIESLHEPAGLGPMAGQNDHLRAHALAKEVNPNFGQPAIRTKNNASSCSRF